MTTATTPDVYRCHACSALNVAEENDWCLCTGSDQALVCAACNKCFCDAPMRWKLDFWSTASSDLHLRRRNERRTSGPLGVVQTEPSRPVILLIEDDRTVHSIVARVLAGVGGTLLHAYDGAEGLAIARKVHPDLVLADALLPLVDGREISRTLKTEEATRDVKVVVITALYKGSRYRYEAIRDYLADDYIEKPISAQKLRSIVTSIMNPHHVEGLRSNVAAFGR